MFDHQKENKNSNSQSHRIYRLTFDCFIHMFQLKITKEIICRFFFDCQSMLKFHLPFPTSISLQ